ncbi:MAG: type II toxin-antitoxin system RelE/ParE family toxin [Candidatus Levybacteria bacterium]|nr:type II toxin-antitoxin system RelE/ParE family toxin [Candidatus Levybacteria bacterium]
MPVEEFIRSLDKTTISKITHDISLLEMHGPILGMPHSKNLTPALYELRIRGKQEIRIIYGFIGKKIYLLHGFKKKTPKTPAKEIKTAQRRFNDLK